jgi:V/A-type H+-transporting ATPase subunit D
MELMNLVHNLRELQEEAYERFAAAYEALESAIISMGKKELERVGLISEETADIDLIYRSVMGVPIPEIQAVFSEDELPLWTGLDNTSSSLDDTRLRFWELMQLIFQWGELEIAIWRLTSEIRKTQRRVNALENIFIPEYQETIKLIEETLEENDREEFFRKKKVKKKGEKVKG